MLILPGDLPEVPARGEAVGIMALTRVGDAPTTTPPSVTIRSKNSFFANF
jgi:hypothetical protein